MITLFHHVLFDIAKPVIVVEVPFCTKHEVSSKQFMQKFHNFTGRKFDLQLKWIKILFKLKDNCLHPAYKIYHGVCSCRETYIGETTTNVETTYHTIKKIKPLKAFE